MIPSSGQWSIFRTESTKNMRRLLFDVQLTSEQLGSRLQSGETIVLLYFGYSDRHTGDWFIKDNWMNTKNDSNLQGTIERPLHRLLSKFVSYLAARLEMENPLEDVSLVIVLDSCPSGGLCASNFSSSIRTAVCSTFSALDRA